jgi:hypothetical protein
VRVDRKEYDRQWRANNKDKVKAAQAKYRAKNRERILAARREQYAASPERKLYNNAWNAKNRERARLSRKVWSERNRLSSLVSFAKCRARKLGREFSITKHDLVLPTHCPVFGFRLSTKVSVGDDRVPSIDRIDSTKGYVKGNVAVISLRANQLKNNATVEELEALVRWMKKQC